MSPTQFKSGDAYFGPLGEYLQTPSGVELSRMMLGTDAALDLPEELQKLFKGMDAMQMLALNHACLVGWRAAWRHIQNMAVPASRGTQKKVAFADSPDVKFWEAEIEANRKRLEEQQSQSQPATAS